MSPPFICPLFAVTIVIICVSALPAADEKKVQGPDPKALELMKPGPEHQRLANLVGTWDVACRLWMAPDAPVTETTGGSTFKPVFDGRFIEGEFTCTMLGKSFVGHSIVGYDRAAKHYVSTWYDNVGTGITCLTGPGSDGGKTISYAGEMTCPQDGKIQVRQLETHQSDDRYTLVMYQIKDGKELKTMELTYTRRQ